MGRSRYAVSIGEEMLLGYKIYESTHTADAFPPGTGGNEASGVGVSWTLMF